MNPYTLDDSLLQQFKQAVFDHDDFLINAYCDFNGENRWNLICSAKDWLSVSVNGLPYIDLNHEIDDVRSLNVAQLIMTYDIVVESVKKLFQVFDLEHLLKVTTPSLTSLYQMTGILSRYELVSQHIR
ncbi:hypothetical protein QNK09_20400 [Brevibacillus agri]|uniref:hypothetical protein n=1 Tax=Brevibacillus agri TaxID=51101 RepID=UPI0024C03C33|nr:hypothetical protein [Brevibacillus agri]WHX29428.1 hypothetical protein QNK09_20400 [Brevibacillus agri]